MNLGHDAWIHSSAASWSGPMFAISPGAAARGSRYGRVVTPKLYGQLADWYTLVTAPSAYEEEATWYAARMREYAEREVRSVLELGCGPGANASFLKQWFEMVVVDLSQDMLRECRTLNPELEQHVGDMRTFRCGRDFDAVFVHDAVSYMMTADDLRAVATTAALHLRPGGVALFCPDDLQENFQEGTSCGGSDGTDGRGARYLSWSVSGPDEHTVVTDYAFLLRASDGSVRLEHDRHTSSRLPKAMWIEALRSAGLSATIVSLEHSEVEPDRHHVFIGVKPSGSMG